MRDAFAYYLMRFAIGAVRLLPLSAARSLGEFAGRIWGRFAGDRRRMARRHMSRVLGHEANLDRITSAVFASYGRYWAETLWVRPGRVSEITSQVEIVGIEHMANARDTGLILVLPHLGNWEAAAVAGPRAGLEIAAVAEQLPNRRLTQWFVKMREAFEITVIPLGKGSPRAIEAAIARKAAVALLADRDLNRRGIEVEFFGERTTLPGGPAFLAQRTGVPVVLAGTYFTPTGYRVVLDEVSMEGATNVTEKTQRIAWALERCIRQAPEQWHLLQPNWPSDRKLEPAT